jgi:hypothetical protein
MNVGRWLMVAGLTFAVSAAPALAQDQQAPAKSHAVLKGTLIGLGAGVAGGALFFGLSNCHYGSDSGAAMVGCGAVTGGIIAGGATAGHLIGHRIEKRAAKPAPVNSIAAWGPTIVPLRSGIDLRLPLTASGLVANVLAAELQ